MTTFSAKPVIFLAFANDRAQSGGYLRNLGREADRLRGSLQAAADLCEVVERHSVTPEQILQVFQQYRERVAIFHYAGHAEDYTLLLEDHSGGRVLADGRGLAGFLQQQRGLQLVFLNACSTRVQADDLRAAGVPMVIATARAIDDELAASFATSFYQSLASGDTLTSAFAKAKAAAQFSHGDLSRHVRPIQQPGQEHTAQGLPWEMYTRPGATLAAEWSLPAAAGNPLWNLPPLPPLDLPAKPFRDLSWFRRADAPIFFGRGQQIRQLYTLVTDGQSDPLVLFYGQSGVGKSSLLDAGLLPRLEQVQKVVYLRRDQEKGLLGTLLAHLPGSEQSSGKVGDLWRAAEQTAKQPLTLILDQVEEHFTRPNPALPDEMEQFLQALTTIFADRSQRPQGKLILSFRKEWLAEIEKRLGENELPFSKLFLERLDEAGVIEAVGGVAHTPALQQKYGLTLEEGLAEEIANDLLKDREAPVAPMLQILLTRLWEEATKRNRAKPHFDRALYDHLRREGLKLEEFLDQQLKRLQEQQKDEVDSGLALDLLSFHTTPLGTAAQHDFAVLASEYRHRADVLAALVGSFQNLYLLVDPKTDQADGEKKSRLAHDTLAPLVRARFDESDAPGQRARRILQTRAVEWDGKDDPENPIPLDGQDLGVVEAGSKGMRAWNDAEQKLIEASRKERERRHRIERFLWIGGITAVLLITAFAGFAWWQWGRADEATAAAREQADISYARQLAAQAGLAYEESPLWGLRLAIEAQRVYPGNVGTKPSEFYATIRSYIEKGRIAKLGNNVQTIIPSEDQSLFVVVHRDKPGELYRFSDSKRLLTLSGKVKDVFFSPDRAIPYYLIDYIDAPDEMRHLKTAEVTKIADDYPAPYKAISKVEFLNSEQSDYFLTFLEDDSPGEGVDNVTVVLRKLPTSDMLKIEYEVATTKFITTPQQSYLTIKDDYEESSLYTITTEGVKTLFEGAAKIEFSNDPKRTLFAVESEDSSNTDDDNRLDKTITSLYRSKSGEKINAFATTVSHVFFAKSAVHTAYVVDFVKQPGEMRFFDSKFSIPLSGVVEKVFWNEDPTIPALVINYENGISELRNGANGELIAILSAKASEVYFGKQAKSAYFGVHYGYMTGNTDPFSEIRRVDSGEPVKFADEHTKILLGFALNVTEEADQLFFLVDRSNERELRRFLDNSIVAKDDFPETSLLLSSDVRKSFFVTRSGNPPKSGIYQTDNGRKITSLPEGIMLGDSSGSFFSPNGQYLYIVYDSYKFNYNNGARYPPEIRDVRASSLLHLNGELRNAFFSTSPSHPEIVVEYKDERVELWGGEPPSRLTELGQYIAGYSFGLENTRLIVWSKSGNAYLIDVKWLNGIKTDPRNADSLIQFACEPFDTLASDVSQLHEEWTKDLSANNNWSTCP